VPTGPTRRRAPRRITPSRPKARSPGWGIFCQLYELRSGRNWGIGDFADLAELARIAGAVGADFLGINPVHALFLADPDRRSPFTPSNRRFFNPLYISMDDLPGMAAEPGNLAQLRAADLVDYAAVTAAKLGALRAVYDRSPFSPSFEIQGYTEFVAEGGAALRGHALFEALSLYLVAQGHRAGWQDWPDPYRDQGGETVVRFAEKHGSDLGFQLWLQWIASCQLAKAQATAQEAGMRIGIYLDLAVGEAPDGSSTWSAPTETLRGLSIGAPPDVFAQGGQNWNLAAPSPTAMQTSGFAQFRALIAAQLRYAGALRIDHAMALWQLFLVPEGRPALEGTHLRYPFSEMMQVLAEESRAHGAVIIGEDLGWVPPGFREAMHAARMMSYRIFYFETDHGLFRRPSTYPQMALGCISTHDLPTLASWWRGEDIRLRADFGLIDEPSAEADLETRAKDKQALVGALVDAGTLDADRGQAREAEMPGEVLTATCAFLAATPCLLVGIRLADLAGPEAATNVPGTIDEHPNWQRRSPVSVDDIAARSTFGEITATMRKARPRGN